MPLGDSEKLFFTGLALSRAEMVLGNSRRVRVTQYFTLKDPAYLIRVWVDSACALGYPMTSVDVWVRTECVRHVLGFANEQAKKRRGRHTASPKHNMN